jgi:hypothetical protein
MKKINLFIVCLFVTFSVNIYCQDASGPVGQGFTFAIVGSNSTKWEIFENGGSQTNGTVATIRKTNGQSINFDERVSDAGAVIITFNCNASNKVFTVKWNTYNWFGGNVGDGTFQAAITPPPAPNIVFSSINGTCDQVTLCITNPTPTVTYAWNNAMGAFMAAGQCAVFTAPPPAQVLVVSTCGIGPNAAVTTPANPPNLMNISPGVTIQSGGQTNFIQACRNRTVSLEGISNSCVNSPANWVWSSSGGVISNRSVSSGSTASASFRSSSVGTFTVTLTVTDFMMNVTSTNFTVEVLPTSDAFCGRFIPFRDPKNNDNDGSLQAEKTKAEMTDASTSENTEGVSVNINNTKSSSSDNRTKTKIYPNPATNEIVIEDLQEAKSIRIFDITGNFKEQINVGEDSNLLKVNTSKYTNGMYLIQIQNNVGEVTTQKIQILK